MKKSMWSYVLIRRTIDTNVRLKYKEKKNVRMVLRINSNYSRRKKRKKK